MEKDLNYQDYLNDIRLTPAYVYLASIFLGHVCVIIASFQPYYTVSSFLYGLSLFFFLLPGLAVLVGSWKPSIGAWMFITGLILSIIFVDRQLYIPGFNYILIMPPLLALILLDPKSALITAVIESGYLTSDLLFTISHQNSLMIVLALFIIWIALFLVLRIYWSNYQFFKWTREYSNATRESILASRKNNEKFEQILSDLSYANNLLLHANERADKLRDVAEEAKNAKAIFVANVSHEFRTPLNMILGLVELMVEAPHIYKMRMPEALESDLRVVLKNCQHLSEMINDVLDLTRLESGQISLRKEKVNLVEIMEEATQVIQPLITKKNLDLSVSFPECPPIIFCDKTRIRQVILNLMSNAARFTDRGSIHSEITCQDQQVSVKVTDTGPGISADDLEKIFEPFMQGNADPWKAKEGSGLGLSISKQFVELHGGQMRVKSESGAGSSFMFTLPVDSDIGLELSPTARIKPDWVWRENQFKSALVDYNGEKIKPCIITCDREGYLAPVLEEIKGGIAFKTVRESSEITEVVNNNLTKAVLFISPNIDDLLRLFEQYKQQIKQVPLFGISYAPVGNPLLSRDVKYLIKPITLNILSKALDELKKSLSRILIVDDNDEFRWLLQNLLLIYNPRMLVAQAANGIEALESLGRFKPDAIILDIVMDRMDGWKLIEIMKRDPKLVNIPIIILSAKDPYEWPQTTSFIMTTISEGIPLKKCVDWLLLLPSILVPPE